MHRIMHIPIFLYISVNQENKELTKIAKKGQKTGSKVNFLKLKTLFRSYKCNELTAAKNSNYTNVERALNKC